MSLSGAAIKRKRVCLSIATKLQIVERVENGESISKLASEYNIGNQTVRDMIRKKDKLHRFVISSNTLDVAGGRKTIKKSKFEDLDKAVLEWFKRQRAEGRSVSGPELLEKAKWLHSQMKIPEPFAASQGWLHCFKTRHGIKQWDIQCDQTAVALINRLLDDHHLTPDQLYNAGDTALYWKALPPKTGQKPSSERITLLACTNATGSHKLKLVCVGKSKNPRSLRGAHKCRCPVVYYSGAKAQMSWDVLKDWFFNHFVPDVRDHLRSRNLSQKAVLLLGRTPTHARENVLRTTDGQISVVYLFPNGGLKQPADVVLHELKRLYRKSLLHSVLDVSEFNTTWTVGNSILTCSNCWQELPATVMQKSWRSLCPAVVKDLKVDEGENHEITPALLWENVQHLRGFENVKKEDIEEWFLSDDNENEDREYNMADVDIKEEIPGDGVGEVAVRKVSVAEALSCVQTLLDFLDQEPDSDYGHILTLRDLRKSLKIKETTGRHLFPDFFQETAVNK